MPHFLPLFYLASPALPIGAFAWSQGMEGAIAEGRLRNRAEVASWLAGILAYGLGRFDIPLFSRCFRAALNRDAAGLDGWNALALAGRETAELREEEGRLGEALCRILRDQNLMPAWVKAKRGLGYVAAFALAAVRLGEGAGSFAGRPGRRFSMPPAPLSGAGWKTKWPPPPRQFPWGRRTAAGCYWSLCPKCRKWSGRG